MSPLTETPTPRVETVAPPARAKRRRRPHVLDQETIAHLKAVWRLRWMWGGRLSDLAVNVLSILREFEASPSAASPELVEMLHTIAVFTLGRRGPRR
jgi:hypothetical protein